MSTQPPVGTAPPSTSTYRFIVNGRSVEVAVPGGRRLLDVLRFDLGLTGSKEGCGEGECGACSVLLDGQAVDSCLMPVCQVAGHEVRTVEGLGGRGGPDPLQVALLDTGGVQCGFCTPGMLMAGRAFLDSGTAPTDAAVRESIAGNLCRCTGYGRIVDAIRTAAAAPPAPAPEAESAPGAAMGADEPARVRPFVELADPSATTPRTLDEAYARLAEGGWRPVAGATDVLVERAAGAADRRGYLDLGTLDELRGIRLEGDALVLGAATTYADLRRDPLVAEHAAVLARMAREVGAAQIQNRGTLGGNIATASPAGDSLPLLLALDAEIVVGGPRGERVIPADAFFLAYRHTALAPDELVLRIRVPLRSGRIAVFRKVGARQAQAISVVSLAVSWRPGDDGAWRDVRVALGSVGPTPVRALDTEAALEGRQPTPEVASIAASALAGEISPIDDVRATATYRREVAARILARAVREAGSR